MIVKQGLLGGTFDPVHRGHLQLAQNALDQCGLNGVIFVPSFHPPHKNIVNLTPFKHRVEMVKLAIQVDHRFSVSTIEEQLTPPTYTIDMLNYFQNNTIDATEYFFIIGIDAFLDICTWKNFKKVMNCMHFIVSARQGYVQDDLHSLLGMLQYIRHSGYWQHSSESCRIYYLDKDIIDLSSSEIRKNLRNNTVQEHWLLDAVKRYIEANSLYT